MHPYRSNRPLGRRDDGLKQKMTMDTTLWREEDLNLGSRQVKKDLSVVAVLQSQLLYASGHNDTDVMTACYRLHPEREPVPKLRTRL